MRIAFVGTFSIQSVLTTVASDLPADPNDNISTYQGVWLDRRDFWPTIDPCATPLQAVY